MNFACNESCHDQDCFLRLESKGNEDEGKKWERYQDRGGKGQKRGGKKTQQVSRMRETYRMKENKSSEH